jgi:hypothetical protein
MRYFRLVLLTAMLGCVLALTSNPPTASAKTVQACTDCYSAAQLGSYYCYNTGCTFQGESQCLYDDCHFGTGPTPFLIQCCDCILCK